MFRPIITYMGPQLAANGAESRSSYVFDNSAPQAGARFASLETLYDAVTRRHLGRCGITTGWRCLEVGAGGGSIAYFMSDRVGPTGHVLATDINIDWIASPPPGNLEVRRHDVGRDPLPEGSFDLVHSRAVLTFVPQREAALTRMVAALRPGGWLLVEELVMRPPMAAFDQRDHPDLAFVRQWREALCELMRRNAGDPGFGMHLPRLVSQMGLVDVGAEGYVSPIRTPAAVALAKANVDQTGAAIMAAGLLTAAELDRYRAVLESPDGLYPAPPLLISAWGRRP